MIGRSGNADGATSSKLWQDPERRNRWFRVLEPLGAPSAQRQGHSGLSPIHVMSACPRQPPWREATGPAAWPRSGRLMGPGPIAGARLRASLGAGAGLRFPETGRVPIRSWQPSGSIRIPGWRAIQPGISASNLINSTDRISTETANGPIAQRGLISCSTWGPNPPERRSQSRD